METEKIYCCDRGDDNVLAASILANAKNNDNNCWPMMAAMSGGAFGNQAWNNPITLLIALAFMNRFGFGGYGGFGAGGFGFGQGQQNIEMQNQLQAIRTQLQDNQNADCIKGAIHGVEGDVRQLAQTLGCDYNTMMQVLGDVRTQLAKFGDRFGYTAEKVINAVERGDAGVIQALQNCCCQSKELIQRMGYENQLGQKDIINGYQRGFDRTNTGMERGFSQLGYQAQQDKCDIIRAGEQNTQRVIDTLNNHWKDEMGRENQDLKAQISQLTQTGQIDKRIDRLEGLILQLAGGRGCGRTVDCGCGNGCGL